MSDDSVAPPRPWNGVTATQAGRAITDAIESDNATTTRGCTLIELWPTIIGLMERNCLPGNELHPTVRALYARFLALVADGPGCVSTARYAAWLAGDIRVDGTARAEFAARWARSRPGASPPA